MNSLAEQYFEKFRVNIIGIDAEFESPYGQKKLVYADWIASGRLYKPIETKIAEEFGPFVGNTHSEASETGVTMTLLYHQAHRIIKQHVNASPNDVIITTGSGMTGAVSKFQRILGIKYPEQLDKYLCKIDPKDRPIVFVTHMEHHSNHTSWLETLADVVVLEPQIDLTVCADALDAELQRYADRTFKIGSFSAGSNVTGIIPQYYKLAEVMHKHGGFAFVDFAASAPYIEINMHPENVMEELDAIFFSPHKMLGGPGSAGVLIFNKKLYSNKHPDQPGGGTVVWTNRWNEYAFVDDIEQREDGGTPAFLQTMRIALAIKLKEQMGTARIAEREHELMELFYEKFDKMPTLHLLANEHRKRLGIFSFYIEGMHHNLVVKLLNDRFGIQARGGCSCAGTYGHYLLGVSIERSHEITQKILSGDLSEKPGWVRISLHPTMSNDEALLITNALERIVANKNIWEKDYIFDKHAGEFFHKDYPRKTSEQYDDRFNLAV